VSVRWVCFMYYNVDITRVHLSYITARYITFVPYSRHFGWIYAWIHRNYSNDP
jgi:hypothetical protein